MGVGIKDQFSKAIGPNGFATGDELDFYWLNGGGLMICIRGEVKELFRGTAIEKRLLEVYIDSKRTVSLELVTNLLKCLEEK